MPSELANYIKLFILEKQKVINNTNLKKEQDGSLIKLEWIFQYLWNLGLQNNSNIVDLQTSLKYFIDSINNVVFLEPENAKFLMSSVEIKKMLWFLKYHFFMMKNDKKAQIDILRENDDRFIETAVFHLERINKCNLLSLLNGIDNKFLNDEDITSFFGQENNIYAIKPAIKIISYVKLEKEIPVWQKVVGIKLNEEQTLFEGQTIGNLGDILKKHYEVAYNLEKYRKDLTLVKNLIKRDEK